MTTTPDAPTLTPPPTPAGAGPAMIPPSGRRPSSRVVAVIAICAGAVLIAGTVFTGILGAVRTTAVHTDTLTASAAGLTAFDVEVSAAEVTVTYDTVTEATLTVTGGSGADSWRLERNGDRLIVAADRDWWSRWGWLRGPDTVELVLPVAARGADADVDVDSGSFTARGDFGVLDLSMNAGSLRIDGTAQSLMTDVNAGSARVDLDGVTEASLTVNAGSFDGTLSGTAPSDIAIDVSAGRIDLTVPDTTYALTSEVSAGRFSHELATDPGARNRIDVQVSAGAVILTPGR